jgi:putative tryptophan/tyrosine transport system substrate-binding protein
MRRRAFISLLGGAAAWPLAARAQQRDRMRRIGVLMNRVADDPEAQARLKALVQGLQQLGWAEGRNVRMDVRWTAGVADRLHRYAAELVALMPEVILADGALSVSALQGATRSVPIIFAAVPDPVGAGFVKSLARPGGNTTGFTAFEYAIAAKWLELLKEIAPSLTRAAVLRDPTIAAGIGQFAAIQAVGPIAMELSVVDLRDTDAIERDVAEFARGSNGADCDGRTAWGKSSQFDHHIGGPLQAACRLPLPLFRRRRRADVVWARPRESVSPRGWLRRSHPQG